MSLQDVEELSGRLTMDCQSTYSYLATANLSSQPTSGWCASHAAVLTFTIPDYNVLYWSGCGVSRRVSLIRSMKWTDAFAAASSVQSSSFRLLWMCLSVMWKVAYWLSSGQTGVVAARMTGSLAMTGCTETKLGSDVLQSQSLWPRQAVWLSWPLIGWLYTVPWVL